MLKPNVTTKTMIKHDFLNIYLSTIDAQKKRKTVHTIKYPAETFDIFIRVSSRAPEKLFKRSLFYFFVASGPIMLCSIKRSINAIITSKIADIMLMTDSK